MAYKHLFVNVSQTAKYAAARPTYPSELYEAILSRLGPANRSLAVDVCTGSGQAIHGLAPHFTKVVGTDASAQQLGNATRAYANVEYLQGDAHDLQSMVPEGSADLVTVAQGLHWLDRPKFYKTVCRVLKPKTGVFAAFSYEAGMIHPLDGPANKLYLDMFNKTLGPYWDAPRILVDNQYRDMEPLEPYFDQAERLQFDMNSNLTVDQMVGYVGSWSAYAHYRKRHPERPDLLIEFREHLEAALASQQEPSAGASGSSPSPGSSSNNSSIVGTEPTMQVVKKLTLLLGKGPKV